MRKENIKIIDNKIINNEIYEIKSDNFDFEKIYIPSSEVISTSITKLHVIKNKEYFIIEDKLKINEILEANLINNIKIKFKKNPNLFKSLIKNKNILSKENFVNNSFVQRIYDLIVTNKRYFNFDKEIENIENNNYNINLIENLIEKSISEEKCDEDEKEEKIDYHFYEILKGNDVIDNFNSIKNTILEYNNILFLIENLSIEDIEDMIVERKPYFQYEKLIKRNFKNEYSKLINKKNKNTLVNMFKSGIHYEDFLKEFIPKIKRYKSSEQFFNGIKSYINLKSNWVFEEYKKKFYENKAKYVEIKENVFVVKIENYEQSKNLGSSQWCISYGQEYFEEYTKFFGEQFFIYDFNKGSDDKMSLIGFTTDIFSNVKNVHDRFDNSLENEDYEEIVKRLKIKDKYYINQKINKTKNKFWKFVGFIKLKDFKSAQENYTGDEKFELKTLLNNIELDENTVNFLNKNKVFSNLQSFSEISFLNLKKLINFNENIKDFDELFVYYLNNNGIERDNIINSEKMMIEGNEKIKDKIVDIFVNNPFKFYSSFYTVFDFFKSNYEKNKKDYNLNSENFIKIMLRSDRSRLIEENIIFKKIISNLKEKEVDEIVKIALRENNYIYLSLIDDKFFKGDIKDKIDDYLSKKNNFYFNQIVEALNENDKPNKILKYIIDYGFKENKINYTKEKKYLFKNEYIRNIAFKNKLFNIEDYLSYLHYNKYVKKESFNIDKSMEKDILKVLEKAIDTDFTLLLKEKIEKNKNKIKPF